MLIPDCFEKFSIVPKGIIHIGAHMCEEREIYEKAGCDDTKVLWIEGNPRLCQFISQKFPTVQLYNGLISDKEDDVEFIVTNNGQSSSFLELKEHKIQPYSMVVTEGQREKMAGFDLEFVAVNHSIPDALAVVIRTAAGSVLHTGDFKMDQIPLDGRLTDLRAFARIGEEGLDLFLCDSTNADVPGFTPLEKDIGPVIENVIARSKGKVVVASFSSHVHRVQQVIDAALSNDRKVVLVGRSMVRNMQIALEMGYLNAPADVFVDLAKAASYQEDKLVYMCTGSQGEPMAVLARMVNLDHQITIGEGDTVILASSLIPGN